MALWQIIGIICVAFVILEMLTPTMFFLNFAIAALVTAIISVWISNIPALILIFVVFSIASIAFLRPLLYKKSPEENKTGIEGKYIGKIAKVEADISKNAGLIAIYGERWEARVENDDVIPAGSDVKILRNDSLIMYVEKV